jgi:hypothetical protein
MEPMQRPEIRPSVGFCIQTDSLGTPAGRWYLNICRHRLVDMPIAHSGKVVTRDFILTHGIGSMKIPFDMGTFRKLKERADGARHTSYCVDVVFNPFIVQMFTDDNFNETMKEYRPFIINLVLQRVESSIGVKLSSQKVKLVKKFLYKDGEGFTGNEPREFIDLPQEIDMVEEAPPPRKSAPETAEEPLIQDVTPGKKKTAMKKGFLNNAKDSLYGPEGSKEGVLPENAGDPLGYLPKKLRNTCKVVDCNSPEYQAQEQKKKAAENHNKQASEWNEMLTSSLGAFGKTASSPWGSDDLPDGVESSAAQKYENDYSRFDRIQDVEEQQVPETDHRDWYYDEKGVPRKFEKPSKATASSGAETGPAIKKGFFGDAKTPLYPKGSEQKAPLSQEEAIKQGLTNMNLNEEEMMKNLGLDGDEVEMMRSILGDGGLPKPKSDAAQALEPSIAAKVPERKAPEFTLDRDDNEGLLQLIVDVPGLESMKGVDLDVTDTCASLAFPSASGLKPLKVELPAEVAPSNVRAKFSKKTHQLTVNLPLLLQVAKAG